MTLNKITLHLIFPLLVAVQAPAQTAKEGNKQVSFITGQLFDSKTKKPIPHAEIFVSGTTIGCISDSLGNFHLHDKKNSIYNFCKWNFLFL